MPLLSVRHKHVYRTCKNSVPLPLPTKSEWSSERRALFTKARGALCKIDVFLLQSQKLQATGGQKRLEDTRERERESRREEQRPKLAAVAPYIAFFISSCCNPNPNTRPYRNPLLSSRTSILYSSSFRLLQLSRTSRRGKDSRIVRCSAANKPSPSSEISSAAKIRSEVLTPFCSVRMFFYLAFIASAGLGGLISTPRQISALANSSRSSEVPEILKNLGIDLGAALIFAFLYSRENNAKNAQISRLSREERLSKLKVQVDENRIISTSSLRGLARLVILAGPASFIEESFKRSKSFTEGLLEIGILVVPFATDGKKLGFEFDGTDEGGDVSDRNKRLWQLSLLTRLNGRWIDEQKKMANVSLDSPVRNLSLRMDGHVRGSGIGYPPWNAFVAQLPPVKGIWSRLLDGMDGRVL